MQQLKIDHNDTYLLRKLLPLICLSIPWEVYFYSSGWGIKFSVFYANFDIEYGTLFVSILRQITLLSYGGLSPSIRTLAWFFGAILCIALMFYEILKENIEIDYGIKTSGYLLICCGILTLISSIAVWNVDFKTLPIAPFFFAVFGYLFIQTDKGEQLSDTKT
ncbi:hypothetical protein [Methanolobus psychrotolerans]|uniref:hypothetical protein n=1 Tax=Methanolobus psychrotolerans TaxID=1874706 RepID=UPI000B918A11|nr:hypothetical protein [Methanolobus psychrotolerans]